MALLLYDRQAGQGELYTLDAQAHISLLKSYSGWRTSWTQIIPIYILQEIGTPPTSLLFYDSTSGAGQLSGVDTQGNLTPSSPQTWSKGWTDIISGSFIRGDLPSLLFYNRESGLAQFSVTDGSSLVRQVSSTTWSTGWTHIVAGEFLRQPLTSLFFYNSTNGVAQFYSTDGNGGIQQLSNTTWSTGWTHIIRFFRNVGEQTILSTLLFYNQKSGAAEFYDADDKGNIQRVSDSTTWRKSWALIAALLFTEPY